MVNIKGGIHIPSKIKKKNNKVQSILVSKSKYSSAQAKKIIKSDGYHTFSQDETKNYYKFRQFDPNKNKIHYTKSSSKRDGIKYIIEF